MTTIKWTTTAGNEIEITVSTRYTLNGQGRERTHGRQEVSVKAIFDGKSHQGYLAPVTGHPVAVAKFGKIGLIQANYDRVQAAVKAAEATIKDHNDETERRYAAVEAVSQTTRDITAAMRHGE